ncbi:hypothetical protein BWQ96_03224 [Gracilariopsis chorda]|uniref:Uncharacterized protein n=1 Tax=Gracilariopsis chorda TaxID=448386 RepID=A0A2V3IY07_9FLOR|nr:hypothetical protein BWQ96_03224 [Gracilariopsis chorda]|eukprot:PXF47034.1 hypothetical protein BWQ96_03224 [Gracilariopsis chorda]
MEQSGYTYFIEFVGPVALHAEGFVIPKRFLQLWLIWKQRETKRWDVGRVA